MKEWIMENFDAAAIASIVSVVGSVVMAIIGLVNSANSKRNYRKLVTAIKLRATWTKCPHCGKKVYFDEFHWYLKDGEKDDNLNGVPDDQE